MPTQYIVAANIRGEPVYMSLGQNNMLTYTKVKADCISFDNSVLAAVACAVFGKTFTVAMPHVEAL